MWGQDNNVLNVSLKAKKTPKPLQIINMKLFCYSYQCSFILTVPQLPVNKRTRVWRAWSLFAFCRNQHTRAAWQIQARNLITMSELVDSAGEEERLDSVSSNFTSYTPQCLPISVWSVQAGQEDRKDALVTKQQVKVRQIFVILSLFLHVCIIGEMQEKTEDRMSFSASFCLHHYRCFRAEAGPTYLFRMSHFFNNIHLQAISIKP